MHLMEVSHDQDSASASRAWRICMDIGSLRCVFASRKERVIVPRGQLLNILMGQSNSRRLESLLRSQQYGWHLLNSRFNFGSMAWNAWTGLDVDL